MGSIADYRCAKCGAYTEDALCSVCMCKPAASQSKAMTWFLSKGCDVATPARENAPYDMVVKGRTGWRTVQVKTAYLDGKHMRVNLCRTDSTSRKPYEPGETDYFFVVCDSDGYLIPYSEWESDPKMRINIEAKKYVRFRV